MDSNRKPRPSQVWETRVEGQQEGVRPRIEREGHMRKLRREKGKTLQGGDYRNFANAPYCMARSSE